MWIHEKPSWTRFSWDLEELTYTLSSIRHRQGLLFARMESLGFDLQGEAQLKMKSDDILSSSAIEGDLLDSEEVRSSVARRLNIEIGGIRSSSRYVDGIVDMAMDATQRWDEPVTSQRLFSWHAALFPAGRSGMQKIRVAEWRQDENGPMQVISGPMGREQIHYEAPQAARIPEEMDRFLSWCNGEQNIDPVLKAGIVHFWFVTIHPFEDGNGRIARALADLFLARSDNSSKRFYSMSRQIGKEKSAYYHALETQQRSGSDLTLWLKWFLSCLDRALAKSEDSLSAILFKAHLWDYLKTIGVNARETIIINRMLGEDFKGFMHTSKYAKLAKCSIDTALRDIQDLKAKNILLQNEAGGRSTSYRLTDVIPS